MPVLAPQPAQPAAAASKKQTNTNQENSGFSDIYEDMDGAKDRPSDDLPNTAETKSDRAEDAPVESDSASQKSKPSSEKETSEEADFAATETPDHADAEAEAPLRGSDKRAALNATETAAMMRMSTQAQGEKATTEVTVAQPQNTAALAKQASGESQAAAAAKVAEASQTADGKSAQLAAEAPEGLDPMQVQVRNKSGQQAQTIAPTATAAQKAMVDQLAQESSPQGSTRIEIDADADAQTPKSDAPSTPTISTTQQMQARAIMEQVYAGSPSALTKSETPPVQAAEAVLTAALEESSMSSRGIMNTQEAASQARLANSAPNPAYVVRQIADAVKTSDKNLIELTMDPPELGKVRMSLAETGGVMAVTISADSQATTELMRRHMDLLRKDFMEMGYQDVSFSFEQGGSDGSSQQAQMDNEFGQGDGGQGDSSRGDSAQADASISMAAQQNSQLSAASSGVDIRL